MSALSKKMDNATVLRDLMDKTREAYLGSVRGLAKYDHRPPDGLPDQEIQVDLPH